MTVVGRVLHVVTDRTACGSERPTDGVPAPEAAARAAAAERTAQMADLLAALEIAP